jgi:hypothetical protein
MEPRGRFLRSPDKMDAEEIRRYQLYLLFNAAVRCTNVGQLRLPLCLAQRSTVFSPRSGTAIRLH